MSVFTKLLAFLYRFAQRLIVLDITRLLVLEVSNRNRVEPNQPIECRRLSRDEVLKSSQNPELQIDKELADRLVTGLDHCIGAVDRGQVVGYLWVAQQGIEAEHNVGNHPLTGVAVSFGRKTGFVYKAYALPSHRGLGIFPALLSHAAGSLGTQEGIHRLVSTTDWTNDSAFRAFQRSGFRSMGLIWRAVVGGVPITVGPSVRRQFGIELGSDAIVPARTS